MKKHILILSIFIMTFWTVAALASEEITVDFDRDSQRVTVSGILADENMIGTNVTIQILKPGKGVSDISRMDISSPQNIFKYVKQCKVGNNGRFEISFVMDEPTNAYPVRVLTVGKSEPVALTLNYYNQRDIGVAIAEINDITDLNQMIASVERHGLLLGLKNQIYTELTNRNINFVSAYQSLIDEDFSGADDISVFFEKKLFVIAMSRIDDKDIIAKYIKNYSGSFLDVQKTARYRHFADSNKKNVVIESMTKKNYDTMQDIIDNFNLEALSLELKDISTWSEVYPVLCNSSDVLTIHYQKFNDLSAKNQSLVEKEFLTDIPTTLNAISNRFNALIDKYGQTTEPSSGGKTGGGGGGSSVIVGEIMPPVVTPPTNGTIQMFSDLGSVEWAVTYIEELAKKNIINGRRNGIFDPEAFITKEEFVKMLVSALGILDETATSDFVDINHDEWYYPYIATAQKNNITTGDDKNFFGVGDALTREQMVTLCYRAINASAAGDIMLFADDSQISDYARNAVYSLKKIGIIGGSGDNQFEPKKNSTRAETAKVIYELLKQRQGEI